MPARVAVSVQLLGRPRVGLGDKGIPFVSGKRYQLPAYLAYQGDWVSRERVAFLFWPDATRNATVILRALQQRIRSLSWLLA